MLAMVEGHDDDADDTTRLIVIEDLDATVRNRPGDPHEAIGRLLNLTDGIPGQGLRLLFAVTTSAPPIDLHPALVRPGRCLANIELRPFTAEEASAWLQSPHTCELTLAELLEKRGDLRQIRTDPSNSRRVFGNYL